MPCHAGYEVEHRNHRQNCCEIRDYLHAWIAAIAMPRTPVSDQRSRASKRSEDGGNERLSSQPDTKKEKQKDEFPIAELAKLDPVDATDDDIQDIVNRQAEYEVKQQPAFHAYNVLVLYDRFAIGRIDSDRIYRALAGVDRDAPILLVLRSPGGDIASAYFIGKLCREYTNDNFEVAVPREAKSAATLVCCGADVLHLGSLSELGPIDPQLGGMPALAVKHSLEHMAEIVTHYPEASGMLSEYLAKSLPVNIVGHFERAASSAAQYAERLLSARRSAMSSEQNVEIARSLVYDYKDHSFAIDTREAVSIFGGDMVRENTPQYRASNRLYEMLDIVELVVRRRFNRDFWFAGSPSTGCRVIVRREGAQQV